MSQLKSKQLTLFFVGTILFALFLGLLFPHPRLEGEAQSVFVALAIQFPYVIINGAILWFYSHKYPNTLLLLLVGIIGLSLGGGIAELWHETPLWFVAVGFLGRVVGALLCYQYFVRRIRNTKNSDRPDD